MKYFIPTYEQAVEICEKNSTFYETRYFIETEIVVFNYRLATYNDFLKPIKGSDISAFEMRGLTFVKQTDGSWKHFLALHKFFNVNQVEETQYSNIKNLKIKSVYDKCDGSLISFIKLPNGRILPKTKVGFTNEQQSAAQELYDNNITLQNFVKYCLSNDLTPTFEYVSFNNKIVLHYNESNLILTKVRNNSTGEYLDLESLDTTGLLVAPKINNYSLDNIIAFLETAVNIEGYVIQFENDLFCKAKSADYCSKHRLFTESLNRENDVIELILTEKIDDAISLLNPVNDAVTIKFVNDIEVKVLSYINNRVASVKELLKFYNGDMKAFAINYRFDKDFSFAAMALKDATKDIDTVLYDAVKAYTLKITSHLAQARKFLKS